MKIESIEIIRVAMPLVSPFRTAFGDDDCIESVLVRLQSGGQDGWGESAPWTAPAYSSESARGAFMVARDFLAPLLLGQNIESGEGLQGLLAPVKGNPFAKAGFDLAWWDLHAKQQNVPLWKLLGGRNPVVEVGADFGVMESIDALLETMNEALQRGYGRIKLKFRPGWDLEMIRAARRAFPEAVLHIDCNSAYSLDDLPMFRELDTLNLAMIEQPLAHDDLLDHAALGREINTPICLDESITSPAKARKAIQMGACGWVNIKPGRVGGLTPARQIHDLCQSAGTSCWVGGMLESAVGAAHCLALATLPNIRYPSDIFPSDRFYRADLSLPPLRHSAPGRFEASDQPGCGAAPCAEALHELALETALLR